MALEKLFTGVDSLQVKGTASISVSTVCSTSTTKHLLLYFSAQWCPPCRRFSPLLVKTYKDLRETRTDFDIVFVSVDQSPEEFTEYSKEFPFPSVPFFHKKPRERLLRKFSIQSLPTLVVLDENGKVKNKNAVSDVREENALDKFPWAARTLLDVLSDMGPTTKNGVPMTRAALTNLKHFAIYYAAQWSPPCRAFTPQLMSIYKQVRERLAADESMEIFFVSCDRSVEQFQEFYDDMPWAKVDFQHPLLKELLKLLELDAVPALMTFRGADGGVINKNARYAASDDLSGERFPWVPEPLPSVCDLHPSEAVIHALNEHCCFILHANGSSNFHTQLVEFRAAAEEIVPPYRKQHAQPEDLQINFFVTPENDVDLLRRVVAVAQAQIPPAGKAYVLCVSAWAQAERMKEVFAGDLTKELIVTVANGFIRRVNENSS